MTVKSPFNYIGNKYRIIEDIKRFFPKKIDTMVDIFCGGCDVTANVDANKIYANDINYHVIDIMKSFQKYSIEDLLDYIDSTIKERGLSKENEKAYLDFRKYYNETRNPLDLYVLMCFSFNYQFRFNSSHEYNNPFGRNRSSFNDKMRENLIAFKGRIEGVEFSSLDFMDFDYSVLKEGDFLYADPPYLITCGSYNDGKRGFKGWNKDEDEKLMSLLDDLNGRGVKFALSNVTEHKGTKNEALIRWARENKYHTHKIRFDYNNCNYHTKNRDNVTKEVLITNY